MSPSSKRPLEEAIQERLARAHAQQRAGFDTLALQWLALLPEWTDRLAYATKFPSGDQTIEQFVEAATKAHLCETSRDSTTVEANAMRFRMRDEARRALICEWDVASHQLREQAREIAAAVTDAVDRGVHVASGIRCWAELAREELEGDGAPGDALMKRIIRQIVTGRTAESPFWLYAGEGLEPLLAPGMTASLARAKRRLDLHYRSQHDKAELRRLLPRAEQVEALDRLIASDTPTWAVHFMGRGGVGKTMLMRYLTGPYAEEHQGLSAARLDFDHVDARYPTQRPGQLLQELAEGFSAYVGTQAPEQLLRSLLEAVAHANAVAEAAPLTGDPLATLRTPAFAEALRAFASFVDSLKPPVVLVLDTCEELAKLHAAGENVPSVDATFELIERLHELTDRVRVVFAGRRPLTSRAANWSIADDPSKPPSVMHLAPRTYLAVHEVRGFNRDEVRRYLTEIRKLTVDDQLFEAVLRYAHDPSRIEGFDHEGDTEPRYAPYDVSLLANWIEEDPDFDIRALAADEVDPYVVVRIIGRLGEDHDVLKALPAAVLLGRFHASTLKAALSGAGEQRDRTLLTLAEQEWIRCEGGTDLKHMVLEIEAGLLKRLRRYYDHAENRPARGVALRRLRPVLREALLQKEPSELSFEQVDAAMRVLSPEQAAASFDALAQRVADTQAWPWAERTCMRLLAYGHAERVPPAVRASIRALYLAARLHRGATFDDAALWTTVGADAAAHPDAQARARLAARATLGRLASLLENGGVIEVSELATALSASEARSQELASLFVRVGEAALDAVEEHRDETVSAYAQLLADQLPAVRFDEPLLDAYVAMLAGRAQALTGRVDASLRAFARATRLAQTIEEPIPQRYVDWLVPAALRQRLLLEQLRHALPMRRASMSLLTRCQHVALEEPHTADGERLLSLVVRVHLARGPLRPALLQTICAFEADIAPQRASACAHRATPPLFVVVAEALTVAGRADEALRMLADREEYSVAMKDEELVSACAVATLRLVRRLRLSDRLGRARELAVAEQLDIRAQALAAGALIGGDQTRWSRGSAAAMHVAWQATTMLENFPIWADRTISAGSSAKASEESVSRALDALELELVRTRFGLPAEIARCRRAAHNAIGRIERLRREHPDPRDPFSERGIRLALRAYALGVRDSPELELTRHARIIGDAALEEGELLALRLPRQALELLKLAVEQFDRAGDLLGAFVASLRSAIAMVHVGDSTTAAARQDELINRFQEVLLFLRSDSDGGAKLAAWDEWVERHVAYIAWANHKSVSHTDAPELRLVEMPSAPPPAGIFGRLASRVAHTARRSRAAGVHLLERVQGHTSARVLLALIALLFVIVRFQVSPVSLAVVTLAVAVVMRDLAPAARLTALSARRFVLEVRIERDQYAPEDALVTVSPTVRWVLLRWRAHRRTVERVASFYMPIATILTTPPFRPLPIRLRAALGNHKLNRARMLRLLLTPDVATQPWEARLLADATRHASWSPANGPVIWRRAQPLPRSRNAHDWGTPELLVLAAQAQQPLIRQALEGSGLAAQPATESTGRVRPTRAALLIGTPVATSSGWRLRLRDELRPSEPIRGTDLDTEPADDTIVAPQTAGTIAPFVIVQAPPGGEVPVLDRRAADGLRGFANEAAASGAYAVLAIPSLPPALASELLHTLGLALADWQKRPPATAVTELATRLRSIVFDHEGQPTSDPAARRIRVQITYDLCLYLRREADQ